jgi:IS5 family transposase
VSFVVAAARPPVIGKGANKFHDMRSSCSSGPASQGTSSWPSTHLPADSRFSISAVRPKRDFPLPHGADSAMANMTTVIEPFIHRRAMAERPYPLETMLRIHCMQHWYNHRRRCHKMPVQKSPPCACLPDYPWIAPCRIAPPS